MNLTWRDGIATVLVAAAAVVYGLWILGAVDGLTSQAVAVIVLGLGFLASAMAVVPGFGTLIGGSKAYMAIASLIGVVALVSGVLTVVDGSEAPLAVLVLSTLVLWGLATVRHATSGEGHAGTVA
jgi:hypothetical protein